MLKDLLSEDTSYTNWYDCAIFCGRKKLRDAYVSGARIYYDFGYQAAVQDLVVKASDLDQLSEDARRELCDVMIKYGIQFYYVDARCYYPKHMHPGLNVMAPKKLISQDETTKDSKTESND